MSQTSFRDEKDSMGVVRVPSAAYYGPQTQRAVENFPISGWNLPGPLIRALGLVKLACATANRDLGKLTKTGKNKLHFVAKKDLGVSLPEPGRFGRWLTEAFNDWPEGSREAALAAEIASPPVWHTRDDQP